MALVSCSNVGPALIQWLATATVTDRAALCEALGCGPTDEQITGAFLDCESHAHIPGTAVPTCEQMNDAIAAALKVIWGDSASVKFSGAGTQASPKLANLVVSPDSGNRIEIRNNGVGVFDAPPVNVSTLYVAANGVDTAAGTQAEPLKTLDEALKRIVQSPSLGSYSIFLHAGQTFTLEASVYNAEGKTIHIYAYNDAKYGKSNTGPCSAYTPSTAVDLNRPTIQNKWIRVENVGEARSTRLTADTVNLVGVKVNFTANDTGLPVMGSQGVISGRNLALTGVIADRYEHQCKFSALSIGTSALRLNSHGHPEGTSWNTNNGAAWTSWSPGDQPACLDRPAYTAQLSNIESLPVTILSNVMSYDATTKSLFGPTCNWNPFS